MASYSIGLLVALISALLPPSTPTKREVRWHMATGGYQFKAVNKAWIASPLRRAAMTGVYAEGNFFIMNTDGDVACDTEGVYKDRFEVWLQDNLTVHAVGMLDEVAVKSGAALNAIPSLVTFIVNNNIHGIVFDYEPIDESKAHAQAYAKFLSAAAAAVHDIPVAAGARRKEVAMNVADWTILGERYWPLYNSTGVDLMITMTPTYYETARDWPYLMSTTASTYANKIDVGISTTLEPSGLDGGQCSVAPFSTAATSTNWTSCNESMAISDNCPYNATSLSALLGWMNTNKLNHVAVWRNDIDEECHDGTAPFMYTVLANWIAGSGGGGKEKEGGGMDEHGKPSLPNANGVKMASKAARVPAGSATPAPAPPNTVDPPPAGGECSFSCTYGAASCPLTISRDRCGYMYSLMTGNLQNLIGSGSNSSASHPTGGGSGPGSRTLPSAALALLMSQCPQPGGCCAPTMTACVQPPSPPVCNDALELLKRFGGTPGTSFGGQAYPLLWHSFGDSCFAPGTEAGDYLFDAINRSLPMTRAAATPQEVSYTNMYLMSTVNSILMGEIVGGARGAQAARIGYAMWDVWRNYTAAVGGLHEFTSPTYTYVQLTALYPGYMYANRPGARAQFGQALDMIWADTAANLFAGRGALSGPHSRDYDTLLGHGMLYFEMYVWGLPNVAQMDCASDDPHCEGPIAASAPEYELRDGSSKVGTGEPMTVISISWYNMLHPSGYRPPQTLRVLADPKTSPTRVVKARFVEQNVTANGVEALYAQRYNYVTPHFSIGSASQPYITNTHSKYYPNTESKLVTILVGKVNSTPPFASQYQGNCTAAQWVVGKDTSDPVLGSVQGNSPADCCAKCLAFSLPTESPPGEEEDGGEEEDQGRGGKQRRRQRQQHPQQRRRQQQQQRCNFFTFQQNDPYTNKSACYFKATANHPVTGQGPGVTFGNCRNESAPLVPVAPRESPQVSVVVDYRIPGNPYSAAPTIRNHDADNSHLALHVGAVQEREALLLTTAADSDDGLQWLLTPTGNEFVALTTNVVLPADAAAWLVLFPNGSEWAPPIGLHRWSNRTSTLQLELCDVELPLDSTVCFMLGGGALAVKPFELDGVGGQTPLLRFVADSLGARLNAARLVGQHYLSHDNAPHWINGSKNGRHARFAAVAVAGAAAVAADLRRLCSSVHSAATSSTVSPSTNIWAASAKVDIVSAGAVGDGASSSAAGGSSNHHVRLGAAGHRSSNTTTTRYAPVSLSVGRDLECSEPGRTLRNQSTHSSWNCLTYRRVNGTQVIPGPFTVNGKTLTELLHPL